MTTGRLPLPAGLPRKPLIRLSMRIGLSITRLLKVSTSRATILKRMDERPSFIKPLKKFLVVELFHEARVDEILRFRGFCLGTFKLIEDSLNTRERRVGLLGDHLEGYFTVGLFQSLAVGGLKIFTQDLDAGFLLRLVKINRLRQSRNNGRHHFTLRFDESPCR